MNDKTRRSLLRLYAIAPFPFFFLGIPFAASIVVKLFQATCILFSLSCAFALLIEGRSDFFCRLALLWNGLSAWLVSYSWFAPPFFFLAFQVVENLFQAFSVYLLLHDRGRKWHVLLTVGGCICGYSQRDIDSIAVVGAIHAASGRRLELYPGHNISNETGGNLTVPTGDELDEGSIQDDEMVRWAVVLITMVACLIGGMYMIGGISCEWWRLLRQRMGRRRVQIEPDEELAQQPGAHAIVPAIPGHNAVNIYGAPMLDGTLNSVRGYALMAQQMSTAQLRLMTAAMQSSYAGVTNALHEGTGRDRLVEWSATNMAAGRLRLAYMQTGQLRQVAFRMGLSREMYASIGETTDPRHQLLRWIVLRTEQAEDFARERARQRNQQAPGGQVPGIDGQVLATTYGTSAEALAAMAATRGGAFRAEPLRRAIDQARPAGLPRLWEEAVAVREV